MHATHNGCFALGKRTLTNAIVVAISQLTFAHESSEQYTELQDSHTWTDFM